MGTLLRVVSQLYWDCQKQWHSLRRAMVYIEYIKRETQTVKDNQKLSRPIWKSMLQSSRKGSPSLLDRSPPRLWCCEV